jgi:UDP-glucose 4-epimerase
MLGWEATLGLDDIVTDHWRWQSQNPEGYATGGAGSGNVGS